MPSQGPHWGPPKCPTCGEVFVQHSPARRFNHENMCANCLNYSDPHERLDGDFTPVVVSNKYVEVVENLTHTPPEQLADGCCPCGAVLIGYPSVAMTIVGFLLYVRRLFPRTLRVRFIKFYRIVREVL